MAREKKGEPMYSNSKQEILRRSVEYISVVLSKMKGAEKAVKHCFLCRHNGKNERFDGTMWNFVHA